MGGQLMGELVAAVNGASNRLIDIESLTETELERLHRYYHQLAQMAKRDIDLLRSHSVEEAETRHHRKHVKGPGQGVT